MVCLKLSQLQYFRAVSEYQSFTKASEYLHITQPSLSKAIRELEDEVGFALLLRTKNGVVLTENGQIYLKQVLCVLREVDKLSQIGGLEHSLRIGIPPTFGYCFIPKITRTLAQKHTHLRVIWKEGGTSSLQRWLYAGDLDAAILPGNLISLERLKYVPFRDVQEVLCVSENHPLAKEKAIIANMLENEKFVLFSEEYNQNVPFGQLFGQCGFYPRHVTYTSQLSTALELIEKNMAVSILIDQISNQENQKYRICTVPLEPPFHMELILAWHQERLSRTLREFAGIAVAACI